MKHDEGCEAVYVDLMTGCKVVSGGKCYCRDRHFASQRAIVDACGVVVLVVVVFLLVVA